MFFEIKPFVSVVSDFFFKGVAFGIFGLVLFDFWEIRNLTRINTVSHFCNKTFSFFLSFGCDVACSNCVRLTYSLSFSYPRIMFYRAIFNST